jgi:hypothetical protein
LQLPSDLFSGRRGKVFGIGFHGWDYPLEHVVMSEEVQLIGWNIGKNPRINPYYIYSIS